MKQRGIFFQTSRVLIMVYLVYVSLGVPDSILGVAWPSIQASMEVPLFYGSVVVAVVTILAAGASLACNWIESITTRGTIIFLSSMLTALGLFGIGCSQSFLMLCLSAVPMGIGAGAVDATINNFASQNLSPRHMLWLHGFWGVGAVLGPMAYGVMQQLAFDWYLSSLLIAAFQCIIAVVLFYNRKIWDEVVPSKGSQKYVFKAPFTVAQAVKRVLFTCFFSGFDITISLWMSSYLVNSQRADTSSVGFCMAAYYMAVTLGRFLIGITAKRITVATLIHFGIALTVLSLPLALYARGLWLVVGISLLGLGVAPIHPFTLYETHQRFEASRASKIISYQISASLIGGLAIPAAIGFAMSTIGSWIMAPFLIVLFAIVLVIRLSVIITRRF